MMRGRAFAKVNLGLRVASVQSDGYHPIVSLAQSIDWADALTLSRAEQDRFDVVGEAVPPGPENLAWRAIEELRGSAGRPVQLVLEKSIPVAAGLGGGSADAALALALTVGLLGLTVQRAVEVAPEIGADIPFCLAGGTAWLEGIGERLTPVATPDDFWLGVVVPPFELAAGAVYRRWDELGGPSATAATGRDLPVSLREHSPLGNDLLPAALDLEPALGDWISDIGTEWSQPVLMSGSGPAVFGFFGTESEATEAVQRVQGARAARAARPMSVGWEIERPGELPPAPWM